MKLIDNWQAAPKMLVVQTLAIIAVVQAIWVSLPPDIVAQLPANLVHYVTAGLSVAGVVVRVLKQSGLIPADEQDPPAAPATTPEDPA
jgi:triacylglycerol esterase/lipase EstA (alpha/beta hydrolase family)